MLKNLVFIFLDLGLVNDRRDFVFEDGCAYVRGNIFGYVPGNFDFIGNL